MKFVNTPNEKRYKFYPARGGIFTFKVSGSNDCYVALSAQPVEGLPMYMIVLGGWSNTKSVIRQMGKEVDVAEASTPGIVNTDEMRGFWIRWHGNVISVGREGEDVSFMAYRDANLFPVKYVGIATAYGSTGSWLFDDSTAIGDVSPNNVKDFFAGSKKLTFVKTPNEKRYKFYPARGGIFTFKVSGSNDCYVALSAQPVEGLPMYMIVLGGWSNTKSVIRQMGKVVDVAEASTPGIVNTDEMRGFWIRWHDNVISVGREGEDVSFMAYRDANLFPVKYVGIATAYGSTGSWLFDDTVALGVGPIKAVKDGFAGSEKLTFVKTPKEKSYKFYAVRGGMFSFKVCSSHDCLVALSAQQVQGLPMYEVVIGGWNNSKSAIRQIGMEPPEVVEVSTPCVLNADELRGFWIRWYDNVISVGHEGEDNSFMSYKDPKLFPIKYVGLSTGYGATGSWLFDDITGAGIWVAAANGVIPPNAVLGGFVGVENMQVARAKHEGNLFPGKLHPSHGVCYITYMEKVVAKKEYEVLCSGCGSWAPVTDGTIPSNAVVGGYTADGDSLFIGRAKHLGSLNSGKVHLSRGCCDIGYGSDEISCTEYEIYIAN